MPVAHILLLTTAALPNCCMLHTLQSQPGRDQKSAQRGSSGLATLCQHYQKKDVRNDPRDVSSMRA
jgi:hypothetical protein